MIARFCFFSLGGILFTFMPSAPRTLVGICEKVWDGDTLQVAGKVIRLSHIDAPEFKQRSRWGVPIGKQSTQFLSHLTLRRFLTVELLGKDVYGRWLGRVFVKGRDVNMEMVLQGHAFAYSMRKKKQGIFQGGQAVAKGKKRGFWRYEGVQYPWRYRHQRRGARRGKK